MGGQRQWPVVLPPAKKPVTHFTGSWLGPDPVWTGAKQLVPTMIRSPTVQPVASRYTGYLSRPSKDTHARTYIHSHIYTRSPQKRANTPTLICYTYWCCLITPLIHKLWKCYNQFMLDMLKDFFWSSERQLLDKFISNEKYELSLTSWQQPAT